ncbi:MAG: hypothetical protein KBE22_02025, partial [Candidatus Accumulibacter sp.]|nr:hypothetical protein [Accumulibacter sp.]
MADLRHLATLMLCVAACSPPVKCVPLTSAERDQKLAGRGAWEVTERYLPERFVEVQYTETAAE